MREAARATIGDLSDVTIGDGPRPTAEDGSPIPVLCEERAYVPSFDDAAPIRDVFRRFRSLRVEREALEASLRDASLSVREVYP